MRTSLPGPNLWAAQVVFLGVYPSLFVYPVHFQMVEKAKETQKFQCNNTCSLKLAVMRYRHTLSL